MTHETHAGAQPSGMSPAMARRRLGAALRAAREKAGLSGEEAAAAIQRSSATLSRLENGRATPRVVDVEALLVHYKTASPAAVPDGLQEEIVVLTKLARRPEWFKSFNDVLIGPLTNDDSKRYVEFENDARSIRTYEPELIPGLLQTEAYARAITELLFPDALPADRARFVEFRMARQQVLARSTEPLQFDAIIGEAAIRRRIGDATVMVEQVQRLVDEIEGGRANVAVRIAPVALGSRAVLGGSFVQMDLQDGEGLAYIEGRSGGSQYKQASEDVKHYGRLFSELKAIVDPSESRAILEEVLKALR